MDAGLAKLLIVFGMVLALAFWELYRVSRLLKGDVPASAETSKDGCGRGDPRNPASGTGRDG